MKFYIAGPVGYGAPGKEWKENIKSMLIRAGHEVWDPIENDANYPRVNEMNEMKKNPKLHFKEIKDVMQGLFIDDCKFIENCDFLICYFANKSYGTISEQGIAYYISKLLKKKVKTLCVFHDSFFPDEWVLCCSDYVFSSIDKLEEFIKERFCR